MTLEKPKPKQLIRPMTTGADSAMNQSQFLAKLLQWPIRWGLMATMTPTGIVSMWIISPFCILQSLNGKISLDEVLGRTPDRNQSHRQANRKWPERVAYPGVWVKAKEKQTRHHINQTMNPLSPPNAMFLISKLLSTSISLSKDDGNGNGNDDARKQWSDWLNEKEWLFSACCSCSTHFSTIPWRSLPNDNVKFPNSRFQRQRELTTVNLSFSIFTSTVLLPVHLQRALSTIKNARKKQKSQNSQHFPNIHFQVTFSLPLPSLLLKFSNIHELDVLEAHAQHLPHVRNLQI